MDTKLPGPYGSPFRKQDHKVLLEHFHLNLHPLKNIRLFTQFRGHREHKAACIHSESNDFIVIQTVYIKSILTCIHNHIASLLFAYMVGRSAAVGLCHLWCEQCKFRNILETDTNL